MRLTLLLGLAGIVAAACHRTPAPRAVDVGPAWATTACDTPAAPVFHATGGGLSPAARDSILRDVETRRAAWRARHITHYRLRVSETCFCPRSPPAVVEVREGMVVAAFDTAGRPAPSLRAHWSSYTVEDLFNVIERTARDGAVQEVGYDACLGYPSVIKGNMRHVDTWFQIGAGPLTRPRS
ncbi:MAG TPA: DUF6174 domain-containing protein [Gemmatimonadales bacterium]|jgi:hypothetical protein|nr:DUF6174 domain-containing protein [Gemmatimonadales bacterium]